MYDKIRSEVVLAWSWLSARKLGAPSPRVKSLMITLRAVTKHFGHGFMRNLVLDRISLTIPPKSQLVILGQRGAGKTTLLQVISGMQLPSEGRVTRQATVSPPGGIIRFARPNSTVRQVINQMSRTYRIDPRAVLRFLTQFAGIGNVLEQPLMRVPAPLRQRLDYALIFGIPFDFYMLDELVAPTVPPDFRDACHQALQQRLLRHGLIYATSSIRLAQQFNTGSAVILHSGKLMSFPSVNEAIEVFRSMPPIAPPILQPSAANLDTQSDKGEILG
jgi:capsular polysaccharide transport system ATP-binding protein